jgi:hypothetical protein
MGGAVRRGRPVFPSGPLKICMAPLSNARMLYYIASDGADG